MTDPYVPQGYLPPADAYQPLQPAGGPDANDPLINPPNSGINGWFQRITLMFKRSWKNMLAIFAITHLLPLIGFAVVALLAGLALGAAVLSGSIGKELDVEANPEILAIGIPVFLLIILVVVVVSVVLQSAGYAAATYAATKEAAGYQVRLGEALGYGFRRAMGLTGWQIVVFLCVLLGFLACILPAFYVYAATALVGPIYLFERRGPIGRSFSIFNNNLGRVLGRLALILVVTIGAGVFTSMFDQIGKTIAGNSGELSVLIGATVVSSALSVLIELPLRMVTFSAILLTYTEQRGYEGPATTQTLAAEL